MHPQQPAPNSVSQCLQLAPCRAPPTPTCLSQFLMLATKHSTAVAQWKHAGPTTQRSVDRNYTRSTWKLIPYLLPRLNRLHQCHNRVIFNIMHLFLPPPPPSHHRCIMLNHTSYQKSTAICKVHNVALHYIKILSSLNACGLVGSPVNTCTLYFLDFSNKLFKIHPKWKCQRRMACYWFDGQCI